MKFVSVITLLVLFLLSSAMAYAMEVEFQGSYDFAVKWMDNVDFGDSDQDGMSEDDFGARQQFRLQTDFVASETLRGVLFLESGETVWGGNSAGSVGDGAGGAIGSDGVSLEVRRAFVEFTLPETALTFRIGIQGFVLPNSGLGDPILGADDGTDMAGVTLAWQANDSLSLVAGWFRPLDEAGDIVDDSPGSDEMDVFALALPMEFDGLSFAPYAMLALAGKDTEPNPMWQSSAGATSDDATIWWAGASFQVSVLDPLWIGMDLVYGSASTDDDAEDRSGWQFQAEIDYDLGIVTPGLVLWYSTGDDDDPDNGSETMPVIDPGFYGTSFGFDDSSLLSGGDILSVNALGTCGLALLLRDLSFAENLSHTVRVAYILGTHDEDAVRDGFVVEETASLSTEDSAWEIDLENTYTIVDGLDFMVEFGWVSLNLDEDVWGSDDTSDAWKIGCQLSYGF